MTIDRQVLHGPGEAPGLPFSSAVRVGDLLFLSGQIGNVLERVSSPMVALRGRRARRSRTSRRCSRFAGSSLDRAVKCTVFLADIQDFAAMNAVYATYFPNDPPARSTVAAKGLAGGARVEIECIAVAG